MDGLILDTEQKSVHEISKEELFAAFKAFNAASKKLQQKYDLLSAETQSLRKQLAQKEEEIKRTAGLAMLGETAAGIAHEIRNPLGAIKLFLSLLKDDLKSQPAQLELVEQIGKSAEALDNVVSNILHFAKNAKPTFAPVNLTMLLKEQVAELESVKGKKIKTAIEDGLIVNGQESSLKQVVNNLLLNALQASDEVMLGADTTQGHIQLFVADNGTGIASDLIERVFEPFVSTKNEGTGLGLAIVKRILDQHGATISVQNYAVEGYSGACFKVRF